MQEPQEALSGDSPLHTLISLKGKLMPRVTECERACLSSAVCAPNPPFYCAGVRQGRAPQQRHEERRTGGLAGLDGGLAWRGGDATRWAFRRRHERRLAPAGANLPHGEPRWDV